MNKLYVYTDEKCTRQASRYTTSLRDVNAAVFFIGEEYDASKLKIEVNHVVLKGYKIVCVYFGHPSFDKGISLQLSTAIKIEDCEAGPESLKACLDELLPKKSKALIILSAIIIAALVICAAIFIRPKDSAVSDVDNLSLDDVYLEALIAAGADIIVKDGGISKEEMLTLEHLDLSGLGISNLEPLLYAKNLKELNLSNNNITDITNLAALDKLERLDISNNPVTDTSILTYLPKLTEVVK